MKTNQIWCNLHNVAELEIDLVRMRVLWQSHKLQYKIVKNTFETNNPVVCVRMQCSVEEAVVVYREVNQQAGTLGSAWRVVYVS